MARLSLFSDSYLSDAGPGIGQQLVWPHRFYCDGGGRDSWVAQNWSLGGHFRFSSYSSYIFGKHKNLQLSDSYLSGAVHRIGQHRFYCDGGGGESSLASNSKRSPSTSRPPVAKKPRNQHQLLPTESEGRRSSEGTRAGGVSRFSEEKDEKEVLGRSEKGVTCF